MSRQHLIPDSRTVTGFLVTLTLASCGPARVPPERATDLKTLDTGVTTVLQGLNSRFRNPIQVIVRDSARWVVLQDSLFRERGIETPSVDFQHDMLIVVAGPAGAPGDSTMISRVTPSPQGLQIDVIVYTDCLPGQIRTMPFHVVRVSRRQEVPLFREHVITAPRCR
jgi:hypothetical protein